MKRYEYIDALRGVAALAVVWYHLFRDYGRYLDPRFMEVSAQGARGVQLFYVLSAFTLFMSLHERARLGDVSMRSFFVRRFFRIAPMFYVALAFYLWYYGLGPRFALGDQPRVTGANILANVLFVNGFYPYWINSIVPVGWSVAVEMVFYLTLPLFFRRVVNLGRAALLAAASVPASLLLYRWLETHPLIGAPRVWEMFINWWLPNQFPVFTLGFVLFFLVSSERFARLAADRPREHWAGRGLFLLSLALMALFVRWPWRVIPDRVTPSPLLYMYGAAFVILCLSLALHPTRLVVNPFLRFAGKVSYSVYLTHWACIVYAKRLMSWWRPDLPFAARLVILALLGFGLTLAVSAATYHLVELPFQRLGGKVIRRMAATRA